MKRLNIDSGLFSDPRFLKLIVKLNGAEPAIGSVIFAWSAAQRYWNDSDNGIPREAWLKLDLRQEIIDVGLAEERGDFIYVRGSRKYFEWLRKRVDSGRKGGLARAATADGVNALGRLKLQGNKSSTAKQIQPSSSSSSYVYKKEEEEGKGCMPHASVLPPLAELWNQKSGTLPKVRACGATRARKANARWREKPDAKYWESVITRLADSPFCSGKNDRGWLASFDFLIEPETQHKALEGKYDAKESKPTDYSFLED